MARPEEVPHGFLHGKIVRLRLERYDCDGYRTEVAHWTKKPCTLTDAEVLAHMDEHAAKYGWKNGDVGKAVMVSRLGDVGISKNLRADNGYTLRVEPACLELVPDDEAAALVRAFQL